MSERARVPVPVALCFAYDGTRFASYARQPGPGERTVEGALIAALVAVGAAADAEALALRPGSRTDRGVSARENVVALRSMIPAERLPGALHGRVPGLWPLAAAEVGPGFDPRRAARREYRYFLAAAACGPGGAAGLHDALAVFRGRHDFGAFARLEPGRDPVREILATEVIPGPAGVVVARIVGASFLWQQVRRMMSAALAVSRGETTKRRVAELLAAGAAGRQEAGRFGVAAAEPLVLWRVEDPRVRFRPAAAHVAALEEARNQEWPAALAREAVVAALAAGHGNQARSSGDA